MKTSTLIKKYQKEEKHYRECLKKAELESLKDYYAGIIQGYVFVIEHLKGLKD